MDNSGGARGQEPVLVRSPQPRDLERASQLYSRGEWDEKMLRDIARVLHEKYDPRFGGDSNRCFDEVIGPTLAQLGQNARAPLQIVMYRIAKLRFIDWLRKQGARSKCGDIGVMRSLEPDKGESVTWIDRQASPDQGVEVVVMNRELLRNIRHILSRIESCIVVWHYYEGYRFSEIGDHLKLSSGHVRKLAERARQKLKKRLGEWHPRAYGGKEGGANR